MRYSPEKFQADPYAALGAKRVMPIRRVFALIAVVNGLALAALVASSFWLLDASKRLAQANVIRHQSYLLATELRQSSDDLTRFARTYVLTGEPKWEAMYWDTLAIRNGSKPRPDRYESIYWDIAVVDPAFRADAPTTQEALDKRMEQLGFTAEEMDKLKEAEAHSNALVNIERIAMHAVKGLFLDGNGNFSVHGKPNLDLARRIMHDDAYHQAKAAIMRPISEAYDRLDERTGRQVKMDSHRQQLLLELTVALIALLGALAIGSYWIMARRIVRPLARLALEADHIHGDGTAQQLTVRTDDEVGRLALAFNAVMVRIREALAEVDSANREIAVAYSQINDSINYASLLQHVLLPPRQVMQTFADDHFVLWQPRDVVGGDFYVFHAENERYLVGIVDCAGHGVPGAMMTMLDRAGIDRAIHQAGIASPAAVLAHTDGLMRAMLSDAHLSRAIATNMDAGLVYVDRQAGILRFVGAKISLYWTNGEAVEELKGNRRALGERKPGEYMDAEIPILPGWTYYMTTDGFLDQSGGEQGFSFGLGRFTAMLREHAHYPLDQQSAAFAQVLAEYRGERPQRDDITLLCFRFN
ncbi:MAG: SpoIIE family protein phosphatase [Candidatus Methylumidiphilus sp.]